MSTSGAIAIQLRGRQARATRPFAHPWALALAVALPLTAAYLIASPPAGDLAAATYRSALFGRVGFTTWDTGWYAAHGHWLLGYSLLSPALGWLLGVHLLLVLSAIAACVLFGLIARQTFHAGAAHVAAVIFAVGFCTELLSGRVPYDLGFAIGLGAVLATMRGARALALALALATSVASPVAGAFLAMAGIAGGLAGILEHRGTGGRTDEHDQGRFTTGQLTRHCFALSVVSMAPIVVLNLAFPEGGYEPFASSLFWLSLAGVALVALLLPQGPLSTRAWRMLRIGAGLYALALIGSFAIATPLGGNAARLGPPLAAPLLAGVLWEHRRAVLLALAPLLVYWQLVTPIDDVAANVGNPSASATYYAPLLLELKRLRHGEPTIVEVPLTESHGEAAYLAGHDAISLARGWDRQLDTRYAALFYRRTLSAGAYYAWLLENKVLYVALPDAPLDSAGRLESKLLGAGTPPYLRELWHSKHWRLYRVMN